MKNADRKQYSVRTINHVLIASLLAGAVLCVTSAVAGMVQNCDWFKIHQEVTPVAVHVTNYEECMDESDNGDGAISISQNYHLVGTYENHSGNKSVLVLNEAYSDKSFADKQIGETRNVYLNNDTFGAAGINEVSVPDFDKSFLPFTIVGAGISFASVGLLLYNKKFCKKIG